MKVQAENKNMVVVRVDSGDMIVRKNNSTVAGNVGILRVYPDHMDMVIDTDYGKITRHFHWNDLLTMNDAIHEITHPEKKRDQQCLRNR